VATQDLVSVIAAITALVAAVSGLVYQLAQLRRDIKTSLAEHAAVTANGRAPGAQPSSSTEPPAPARG